MSTNSGNLPPAVQESFNTKLLSTRQQRNIHLALATRYRMEKGSGDIQIMRRYQRLKTAPVPHSVQMNNSPVQQLGVVDIKAQINWYSTWVLITKQVTLINKDPVLNEVAARLNQSMRETEDELMRDKLLGTASVIHCVGGANGDNPTELTASDIDGVTATLQNNDGEFITEAIGGEDKIGTGPVSESYIAMCSSRLIGQFENVSKFKPKADYPMKDNLSSAEWGSINYVRFLISSAGSVTVGGSALGADVFNIFIAAQESHAMIEQDGVSAKFIYHGPGWGDDVAELRQTAAWRMAQANQITNDSWLLNLKCTLA